MMVTGKGGTGKTTFSAAMGLVSAATGLNTVVCEIDTQRSALAPIFDCKVEYQPLVVREKLALCNLTWREAFTTYLERSLPVTGLVRRILENEVVNRFLDFTPGSRELVILSRIAQLCESYDRVIVDMPASGHMLSLLGVTRSLQQLFRAGPVRKRVDEILSLLLAETSSVAFVALPEEMVVNETLETMEQLQNRELAGCSPFVFLNRATLPSLTTDEARLMEWLGSQSLGPDAGEFVRAGLWEKQLEEDTIESLARLNEAFERGAISVGTISSGQSHRNVVGEVAAALGRKVGVTKRDLAWT